jgi:hypothetical protein
MRHLLERLIFKKMGQVWWLTLIIEATWKAEIGGLLCEANQGKKVRCGGSFLNPIYVGGVDRRIFLRPAQTKSEDQIIIANNRPVELLKW